QESRTLNGTFVILRGATERETAIACRRVTKCASPTMERRKGGGVVTTPDSFNGSALIEKRFGRSPYGPKFTVTGLEQGWVPASHTLYMKLAWPVVPVESSYKPSFGVVAITTPSRLTSTLGEVAPLHFRRDVFIPPTFFPWPLSSIGPGVAVAVGVGVGV